MKYFLSTAGKKCCKGCTWLLSLARNEKGYDLIQIKRGFSQNRNLMKLYPGEPAIILDTGEFYIGDASGKPILINPKGAGMPQTGSILCIKHQSGWSQGDVVTVPYSDMITSDGVAPTGVDGGKYSCAAILDENDVPIGVAFKLSWVEAEQSAKFLIGYFNHVNLLEFTTADIDAILEHAEANIPE